MVIIPLVEKGMASTSLDQSLRLGDIMIINIEINYVTTCFSEILKVLFFISFLIIFL